MVSRKNILIAGAILFFVSTSWLYASLPGLQNSPDEAANYAVIQQYVQGEGMWLPAADVQQLDRVLISPRSMRVIGGRIVPAGFLGLPVLYGFLANLFGMWIVLIITPLLALAGMFSFYGIVKRIFDKDIAFWSVLLLMINPVWWYYASRGLLPNVLFASLALVAFYLFFYATEQFGRRRLLFESAAVITFSYTLFVRPSEWWMLLLAAAVTYWNWKNVGFTRLIRWLSLAALCWLGFRYLYTYVYGPDLVGVLEGYGRGTEGFVQSSFWRYILPFGFHPRVMWWSVSSWYINFVAPFIFLAVVGVSTVVISKKTKAVSRYLVASIAITLWLIVLYGSWLIFDNPNQHITIGSAYLRYWIPSFILITPFMAYAFKSGINKFNGRSRVVAAIAIMLVLGGFSCKQAVVGGDGVIQTKQATELGKRLQTAMHQHDKGVEDNAVILTDSQDKFLLTDWQVMQPVKNKDILDAAAALIDKETPVYLVTHPRHIDEWRDLKENWFGQSDIMYTYWFSVDDFYEVHALRKK